MSPKPQALLSLTLVLGLTIAGYRSLPRESIVASYCTPLDGRSFSQRHNALLAIRKLDGAVVEPNAEFSFNRRVGTFSRDQGYRKAPVSFNGELIADWGGGVCQVSTTLYNAALLAGMNIIERNHHRFCPSYVPPGRDAAVAYSNIDLRFANPYPFKVRLHAWFDENRLRVDFISTHALPERPRVVERVVKTEDPVTFYLGAPSNSAHVRNSGKPGYQVVVYRIIGRKRQLISNDEYPVMHRVVQYRD